MEQLAAFGIRGGILSSMMSNVLMHTLFKDKPVQREDAIICYVDDVCIKTFAQKNGMCFNHIDRN